MVIRFSNFQLEQLAELEKKISLIERLMDELNIDCDREKIIRTLLVGQVNSSDQKKSDF